jgi:hypothetical protein
MIREHRHARRSADKSRVAAPIPLTTGAGVSRACLPAIRTRGATSESKLYQSGRSCVLPSGNHVAAIATLSQNFDVAKWLIGLYFSHVAGIPRIIDPQVTFLVT